MSMEKRQPQSTRAWDKDMNFKHKNVACMAVVAVALASAAPSRAESASASPAKPALSVELAKIEPFDARVSLDFSGNIASWQEASVSTTAQGLRVSQIKAEAGDKVVKGQVLALLDDATLREEIAHASASLAEANATLAETEANLARASELAAKGFFSPQQVLNAQTARSLAMARRDAATSSGRLSKARLDSSKIVAPDDGLISSRSATLGLVAPAGQELFRLIRQSRLEWRAEASSGDLSRVSVGALARVLLPSGAVAQGHVRRASPVVDPATRSGLIYVDLDVEPSASASPGMFAKGSVEVGQVKSMSIPSSAVFVRDGFSWVYKIDAQNKARAFKVKVVSKMGPLTAVEGLAPSDKVAASGAGFIAEGDWVSIVVAPAGSKPKAAP
jgi:HlyD family secretion protein